MRSQNLAPVRADLTQWVDLDKTMHGTPNL